MMVTVGRQTLSPRVAMKKVHFSKRSLGKRSMETDPREPRPRKERRPPSRSSEESCLRLPLELVNKILVTLADVKMYQSDPASPASISLSARSERETPAGISGVSCIEISRA